MPPISWVNLDTTARTDVSVTYNLRDIDEYDRQRSPADRTPISCGNDRHLDQPPGRIRSGRDDRPELATLVTPVNVTLPATVNDKPLVQVRMITTNATGADEWVGVDDIAVDRHDDGSCPCRAVHIARRSRD